MCRAESELIEVFLVDCTLFVQMNPKQLRTVVVAIKKMACTGGRFIALCQIVHQIRFNGDWLFWSARSVVIMRQIILTPYKCNGLIKNAAVVSQEKKIAIKELRVLQEICIENLCFASNDYRCHLHAMVMSHLQPSLLRFRFCWFIFIINKVKRRH